MSDALQNTFKEIEKKYGKKAIVKYGDTSVTSIPTISTGSPSLDEALGIGGLPRGRITEIYGNEGSGKTTLALHVMANAQKEGGKVAIIDAEHALDPSYARRIGVDINEMYLCQPQCAEEGLEIMRELLKSKALSVIVIDSVAALVPEAEEKSDIGSSSVAVQARLMSQTMRQITKIVHDSNCVLIFINQVRTKVGVMYGTPETTTGGRALKFYSTIRLSVRSGKMHPDNSPEPTSMDMNFRIVKNKLAQPFRRAKALLVFGRGISKAHELIDLAINKKVITARGSWYYMGDSKLGQGKDNIRELIEGSPELIGEIEQKIKEAGNVEQ